MASEGKRQNAGYQTPVALPNSAPSQPAGNLVSLETALSAPIGAKIRVQTAPPTSCTLEGTLFTADPITNLLVINTSPTPSTISVAGSYRILPISLISTFTILSMPNGSTSSLTFTTAPPPLQSLDMNALRRREADAIAALHGAEARKGPKGTSPEAQGLFDALAKPYKVSWQEGSIVIGEVGVMITKPYGPDNVKAVPGSQPASGSVARIRQIVTTRLEIQKSKSHIKAMGDSLGKISPRKGG